MNKLLMIVSMVSADYVVHHFGLSYGQVIFDYSGGQNYAINGATSNIDPSDVYFVSRGAYFDCCNQIISIPVSQFSAGLLPFSLAMWINSQDNNGRVLMIQGTYPILIFRGYINNRIKFQSQFSNYIGTVNLFPACNFYIDQWLNIFINLGERIKIYINGFLEIDEIQPIQNYAISSFTLGSNQISDPDFNGLIWYLVYSFSSSIEMLTSGGSSSDCLLGSCTPCTFSIYDPVLNFNGCLDSSLSNIVSMCPSICFTNQYLGCMNNSCLKCMCDVCFIDPLGGCTCKITTATNTSISYCTCPSRSYYNTNIQDCSDCYSECASCFESLICDTCIAANALPTLVEGCVCRDGYWGIAPLTSSNSCQPCHPQCKKCIKPLVCSECVALNSIPDSTSGCICNTGFYNAAELATELSCMPCNSNCLTCQAANACITCISFNSNPDNNGFGCNCITGFFNTTQLTTQDSCLKCKNVCLTCNSADACLVCKYSNSSPFEGGCQCNNGYFTLSTELNCLPCNLNCLTCNNPSSCLVCKDPNAIPIVDGTGCVCLAGYYNYTSLNTAGACITLTGCLEFNIDSICTKCSDTNAFVNSTGNCECKAGYVGNYPLINDNSCKQCTKNCLKCQSSLFYQCINCNTSYFYGMCLDYCPLGYHKGVSNACIEDSFSSPVLKFQFDSIGSVFKDKFNNLTAVVSYYLSNSSQPTFYKTIPDRGIFLQNVALEVGQINNQSLLSAQTSISAWLRPSKKNSTFIYKGNSWDYVYKVDLYASSIEISFKVDSLKKICFTNSPIASEIWNHLHISLNYLNLSQISIIHDGVSLHTCTFEAPFLDYLNSSLYIAANLNTSNFFNGYIYEYTQFVYQPSVSDLISTTCNGCDICLVSGSCISSCSYNQYSNYFGECINCSSDCKNGCIMSDSCNVCVDAACIECTSFAQYSCSKCMDTYEAVNGICYKCGEGTYFDYVTRKCEKCKGLCVICDSSTVCLSCREMSELIPNMTCQCVLGFTGDEICEQDYFQLWITVNPDNSLNLIFSEPLAQEILVSDIIIKLNKADQVFAILKYDDSKFVIQISFIEDISENNKEIHIEILKNLTSTYNKLLLATSYSTKLFISNATSSSQNLQQQLAATKLLGFQGATVGASLSLGFSLLNFDPSTIFNFINTAEMFYIVYLLNVELDPVLCEFLLATRLQSKIPNIFSLFFSSKKGVALGSHFIDYGYKSSLFLLNTGVHFTMLLIFLTLGLLLFFLNFNSWIKVKLFKITSIFKYSIFLRLWLQVYLELSIAAVISLQYTGFSNYERIIDFFISILIIVINKQSLNIFGILLFISLIRTRIRLIDSSDSAGFVTKYSTFFEEFKENGLNSSLFYLMFVVKRLVVVICYCFIQNGILQLFLLFTATLTLSCYTIVTRCFKVSLYNYYQSFNELLLSMFYIALVFKRLSENQISWATTTDFCIKLIFIAWGLNIFYSLSVKIHKIFEFIRDFIKARRAKLPLVDSKIIPITEAH